jgi:hypothetical protein
VPSCKIVPGNGATLNLSVRKLNHTGYIQRRCGLIDTEGKARKLRNVLQLSQSIATIYNEQSTEAAQKKIEKQLEYRALAPVALSRLQTNNDELQKITKKEILSIMLSVLLVLVDDKMKKDLLMDAFVKFYEKSPTKIIFLVWRTVATSKATLTAATATSTAPATIVWDEDDATFDVRASWEPHNPIGVINTCL